MSGLRKPLAESRLTALDVARGIAMLLVVIMHCVLGVERAVERTGVLNGVLEFAASFRVPAFFLISGLFLRRAMNLGWFDLFAKRIYGLIILYLVWLTIHLGLRSVPAIYANPMQGFFGRDGFFQHYAEALIEPYGLLWFIYLMMVLLVAARLIFMVPRALPIAVFVAACLETARVATGWTLIDEFSARFVYFLIGLWLGPLLLPGGRTGPRADFTPMEPAFLTRLREQPGLMVQIVAGWAVLQLALVITEWDALRGMSLISGLAGAAAIVLIGLLLVSTIAEARITRFLRHVGERSIVIYLVFTIPMSAAREAMVRVAPNLPVDVLALIVIAIAVSAALAIEWLVRGTRLEDGFKRPVLRSKSVKSDKPPA